MSRKQTILGVAALAAICLAIGIFWTVRTEPPSANPWWAGKDAKVRVEVWEEGKDMATVGMTLPKKTVDTMVAFGMKATISAGDHKINLRDHWRQVQALPKGKKLVIHDEEGTLYVWIETPDMKADSTRAAEM